MSYYGKNEFRDETGKRFGRLVVKSRVENRIVIQKSGGKKKYVRYLCQCDCGNLHRADVGSLRQGHVRSCGCLGKETVIKNFKGTNDRWGGGRNKTTQGYIHIYEPEHPTSIGKLRHSGKYVLEHRLVMEKKIGRYLLPCETVHHKNGIKDNNCIENLELWTSEHPSGSRVDDLTEFAMEHLKRYAPEKLTKTTDL